MPELPEVEVVRQGLRRTLLGHKIIAFRSSNKRLRKPLPRKKIRDQVVGFRVIEIERRAKFLLIRLECGALLIFHLGMTGRLGVFASSHPVRPHDHLCFLLDNGKELRFNDIRRFGFVDVYVDGEAGASDLFADLGPEPFGKEFTPAYLQALAHNKQKPIKNFLMDNAIVVGIGNIYANEILFASGIKPTTPASAISHKQWQKVVTQSRAILQKAISAGGTTISDFENESGKPGYFQLELAVYGKGGRPCPVCQSPITRLVMAGRATFFCTTCQR